ncbi:hypothetical protein BAE44_0019900 [Dichanthelium oligosanthes]|uniref:Uncharacterized protein n=1 Tax=Dichanthelium oligosanthes TaxID=888268 RepID=A0A1E5V1N7_9POAL|nr:hypothetical protein BAE44_0019900 [Dichanthelium oligosanthes]
MLAKVDRTEDSGIASRTRRRKVLRRQNSQLDYGKDSKGTFSDPVDV